MTDPEQAKYVKVYATQRAYGHRNHGAGAYDYFPPVSRILDVGCGYGEFGKEMMARGHDHFVFGIDFACPRANPISLFDIGRMFGPNTTLEPGKKIYLYDFVTAFDVLEHLHPDTLDKALAEMASVAPRYVVSVGTFACGDLHLIVKPFEWWLEKMRSVSEECEPWGMSHGGGKREPYIVGKWKEQNR